MSYFNSELKSKKVDVVIENAKFYLTIFHYY